MLFGDCTNLRNLARRNSKKLLFVVRILIPQKNYNFDLKY